MMKKLCLKKIQRGLGSRCLFISQINQESSNRVTGYYLLFHLTNEMGGKDKYTVNLKKNIDDMSTAEINTLIERILIEDYG